MDIIFSDGDAFTFISGQPETSSVFCWGKKAVECLAGEQKEGGALLLKSIITSPSAHIAIKWEQNCYTTRESCYVIKIATNKEQ